VPRSTTVPPLQRDRKGYKISHPSSYSLAPASAGSPVICSTPGLRELSALSFRSAYSLSTLSDRRRWTRCWLVRV
jgi:hypothetical protein